MNVKEVIFHTIALVLMSCTGAIVELAVIGDPPEIVFLRADDLYKTAIQNDTTPLKNAEMFGSSALSLPTVNQYCTDNKCDIKDLLTVIYVSTESAKEMFDSGEAQFIDARKPENFAKGHIPYTINLPVASFGFGWPQDISLLMKELKTVVYCEGFSCDASQLVAKHLIRYGFKQVFIIEPGFPGWKEAGYPVSTGEGNE